MSTDKDLGDTRMCAELNDGPCYCHGETTLCRQWCFETDSIESANVRLFFLMKNCVKGLAVLDSVTSVLQKYEECGSDGAWKSLGDTISRFKFITRDFMPSDSDTTCTVNEYGIETGNYKGVNISRD